MKSLIDRDTGWFDTYWHVLTHTDMYWHLLTHTDNQLLLEDQIYKSDEHKTTTLHYKQLNIYLPAQIIPSRTFRLVSPNFSYMLMHSSFSTKGTSTRLNRWEGSPLSRKVPHPVPLKLRLVKLLLGSARDTGCLYSSNVILWASSTIAKSASKVRVLKKV